MRSSSADITEPMSPASGAAIGRLLSNSDAAISIWMNLASADHGGDVAVTQQPIQPGPDQHHHVRAGQRKRSCGRDGLRVGVGQQPLGHRHRQIRNAGGFHELSNHIVGLSICRAFAEDDQRPLRLGQQPHSTVDRLRRR